MQRQELYLWTSASAESMFLYYFVGTLALVFLITIFITRALRRRQSQVIELLSSDDYNEPTVAYLVAITTSMKFGCGCPEEIKVFMQLVGDGNVSPYFTLRGRKGGRPLLKRGFTDIFLVKVKESVGHINKVKLVLLGVEGHLKWRISKVQLYNPRYDRKRDVQATVTVAETLEDSELDYVILKSRSFFDWFRSICVYHQWLSNVSNSVRFGAFSDVVQVLFLFTSILTLLIFSLILYIVFPRTDADTDTFDLNFSSFAISSSIVAFYVTCMCFALEMVFRNVRSREQNLNFAYFSLKQRKQKKEHRTPYSHSYRISEPENNQKQSATNVRSVRSGQMDMDMRFQNIPEEEDENQLFVLKYSVCDRNFKSSYDGNSDVLDQNQSAQHSTGKSGEKKIMHRRPPYIENLIKASLVYYFIEEMEVGTALDEKLSLAIINSSTSGIHSVQKISQLSLVGYQENEDSSESIEQLIDAETGEELVKKRSDVRDTGSSCEISSRQIYDVSASRVGAAIACRIENHLSEALSKSRREMGSGKVESEESVLEFDMEMPLRLIDKNAKSAGANIVPGIRDNKEPLDDWFIVDETFNRQTFGYMEQTEKMSKKKDKQKLVRKRAQVDQSDSSDSGSSGIKIEITPENLATFTKELDELESRHKQLDAVIDIGWPWEQSETMKLKDTGSGKSDPSNFGTVSGRLVHDIRTDDVRIEINPETIASFNEELDKLDHQSSAIDEAAKKEQTLQRSSMSKLFRTARSEIIDLREPDEIELEEKKRHSYRGSFLNKFEESKSDFHLVNQNAVTAGESLDLSGHFLAGEGEEKLQTGEGEENLQVGGGDEELQAGEDDETGDHAKAEESLSEAFKKKKSCLDFEKSMKTWARCFVQDLFLKFKSYRDSTAEGYLTYEMTWHEMFDWIHNVVFKITLCMVYRTKQDLCQKDSFISPAVQSLLTHSASEIIVLAIDSVSSLLHHGDKISPPDLFLTSHMILQGISEVTDAVIYTMTKVEEDEMEEDMATILQLIDTESNVKYVARKFLRDCAKWTFQQGKLAWPFIKRLIPQAAEEDFEDTDKIGALAILAASGGLEAYNDLVFVAARLTEYVIEDSQSDIWNDFQNEQIMFTDVLMKLRILACLQKKIDTFDRKKKFIQSLIDEHDKPKSRVQKRMEKRLETIHASEKDEESKNAKRKKSIQRNSWKDEISQMEYADWIREAGKLLGPLIALCKIHLTLRNRWCKQGLKLHMKAQKHLAQSLLYPNIAKSKEDPEGFWFENFLHFKRAEFTLAMFLIGTVDNLVKMITQDTIETALTGAPIDTIIVEDLVVKADISVQILVKHEERILKEVMELEELQEHAIDEDIETKLQEKFSAEEFTASREANDIDNTNQNASKKYVSKSSETGINPAEVDVMFSDEVDSKEEEDNKDTLKLIDENLSEDDAVENMLKELKPLKTYLAFVRREEILHNRFTLQHYLEKSERRRQRACSLNYQQLLDSYYIVEEDEDYPSHTKESLYQLEHDFMGETSKPFSGVIKTILVWVMVIMILFSLVYVGLVAGQLSTTETQEWICYYLLSLAEFGFLLEPLRAILIGYFV